MRKPTASAAALVLMAAGAQAADVDLTLQLKWIPQAQFGGYYVAKDKGFYAEEGLEVAILPGGPEIAPTQVLAEGGADVIVEWMPAALAAREKGLPLVNIAQPFKSSGMMLTCLREAGIADPRTDFAGKTLSTWFAGNEYPFLNWMNHLGLSTEGGQAGVAVLNQGAGIEPLLQKRAACISTMNYNEYWQVIDAGIAPADLVSFRYEDQGVATLEDGLYVLETALRDRDRVTALVGFVRASMRGWEYAREHPGEAAEIVLGNIAPQDGETGDRILRHQTRMAAEVAKLTEGGTGALDEADYRRTVDILLAGGPGPAISKPPEGAFTHLITDRAFD